MNDAPHYLPYVLPHAAPGVRSRIEAALDRMGPRGRALLALMLRQRDDHAAADYLTDHGAEDAADVSLLSWWVECRYLDVILSRRADRLRPARARCRRGGGGLAEHVAHVHSLHLRRRR